MPYTLGIKIDGNAITDKQAKILSLYIMGLSNDKVMTCLLMKKGILHNEVSDLYGKLGINKCATELILLGLLNGFNHYGFVNGIDILDADDRRRLQDLKPRLLREPVSLQVTLTTV